MGFLGPTIRTRDDLLFSDFMLLLLGLLLSQHTVWDEIFAVCVRFFL